MLMWSAAAPPMARGCASRQSFRRRRPGCAPRLLTHGTSAADAHAKRSAGEVLFINLTRRTDRRRVMEERLSTAGIQSAKRFEALTGDQASSSVVCHEWDTSLNSRFDSAMPPATTVAMTAGERGCAASHVALWRRCAALAPDAPPLLVLEDDLVMCDRFGERIGTIVRRVEAAVPEPSERALLVYPGAFVGPYWRDQQPGLAHRAIRLPSGIVDAHGNEMILREAAYVWQTCCYLVWPAAARRLLEHLPVDGPVDNFLAKHILQGRVRALVCDPMIAMQENPYEGDITRSGFAPDSEPPENQKGKGLQEARSWHSYADLPHGQQRHDQYYG
jgi:GR25 family glycosyltransferase involved in LPS biosynthesis